MIIRKVLLLGGSGFIGTSVAEHLSALNIAVTVPTRRSERAKHLLPLPTVSVVEADIFQGTTLDALVRQHDVVINLTGILHGDFERIHVTLPKSVAEACAKNGVARFINMSALNADVNGPSEYLRSRGRGEAAVWAIAKVNPALKVTIFEPSVVFGERDKFLNMFAGLVKLFPVIPLGSPDARFQPIWVEDVARAIVTSIDLREAEGQTYPLVGPKAYTLRELIEFVAATTGKRRLIVGLGTGLSMLQAGVFGVLPGKIITPDNVRSMRVPSTSAKPFPPIFGHPSAIEGVVPVYLRGQGIGPRARYQQFRNAAGR
ncbi:MAG: complex I NDUFA9 subunit family protein [Usitatibacteraceae bacterium]